MRPTNGYQQITLNHRIQQQCIAIAKNMGLEATRDMRGTCEGHARDMRTAYAATLFACTGQ
eukprot:1348817-Amorphochlora_amoeboformis.AAC.1